jgi:hypothetical protein
MGLHGASMGSFPRRSLVRIHRSPRILRPAWRLLFLNLSLVGFHRTSRDVPAPRLIRLATAERPRAGTLPLGTCAASGFGPMLRPAQRCSVLSCRLESSVSVMIPENVMWRDETYVSDVSHRNGTRWIYSH